MNVYTLIGTASKRRVEQGRSKEQWIQFKQMIVELCRATLYTQVTSATNRLKPQVGRLVCISNFFRKFKKSAKIPKILRKCKKKRLIWTYLRNREIGAKLKNLWIPCIANDSNTEFLKIEKRHKFPKISNSQKI